MCFIKFVSKTCSCLFISNSLVQDLPIINCPETSVYGFLQPSQNLFSLIVMDQLHAERMFCWYSMQGRVGLYLCRWYKKWSFCVCPTESWNNHRAVAWNARGWSTVYICIKMQPIMVTGLGIVIGVTIVSFEQF
jgi:hypothetical protein